MCGGHYIFRVLHSSLRVRHSSVGPDGWLVLTELVGLHEVARVLLQDTLLLLWAGALRAQGPVYQHQVAHEPDSKQCCGSAFS
jgi:hypothetical protein